jgi:spore coat protein JC
MMFYITSFGTEEMAHTEMIAALVYKLVDGACPEDFKAAGWEGQWTQHNHGLFWSYANGVPWSAKYIACLGDPLVKDTLRFLWQREVVHFQRFGETLNDVQEWMGNSKYMWHGHRPED